MTDQEIFLEMYGELEKVNYAVKKRTNEIHRMHFTTGIKKPIILHKEYVIPASRNRYVIWHYGVITNNYISWKLGSALLLTNDKGHLNTITITKCESKRTDYSGNIKPCTFWQMSFNNGHFYSRYNERTLGKAKINPLDTIITWFGRNYGIMQPIKPDKIIQIPEKYKDSYVIQTIDGVVFGDMLKFNTPDGLYCEAIHEKTFLPLNMLSETQIRATSPEKEIITLNALKDCGVLTYDYFRAK